MKKQFIISSIVIVGLLVAAYFFLDGTIFALRANQLSIFVDDLGWAAPLFMIGLLIVEVAIAPLPGKWLAIAMGSMFGPWLGFVYAYIGSVVGSMLAFEFSRYLGQPFVKKLIKPEDFKRYQKKLATSQLGIFFLYAIPLFPIDVVSLLLGLTSMERKRFTKLMLLGFIPNMFVLNFFGYYVSEPEYQYVLILLIVLVVIYFLFSWVRSGSLKK